jgi:hypothetical protein
MINLLGLANIEENRQGDYMSRKLKGGEPDMRSSPPYTGLRSSASVYACFTYKRRSGLNLDK